ncbi:serine/threonine-protein kinase [Clostridium tetanomorphum]|uniref:Stk1 family PASTA domain-containing Ser/Thr kinase n=1 Tax=Clostridium tetanomorphum TaxID=1553 RepID=UPI00044C6EB8|nr:Stk1 family PASTA domain-containing Ser/Thr kinase [Clostridium tetanomorphum]KAJ51510.1 protein kinase [Clostridium tetanomorphum DSM 665]MBP1865158.1 serine/threonine-protein kinase [Clostridium tetanomorphum]NRS84703.1 serine/threonine-protein kinase [Clostridium tetanomorphum]SQB91797.1 serine/threonine protein kinase [Clostridium tetanomorphum]
MIGTLLGNRYELLEKIGEGGMAEVYKAKCHLLNRYVAVKILKEEFSKDAQFVEKFKREATAAASISDNNIVNIYDVGSQDGINYIVMEYVKGKTLKEVIREKGKLEIDDAVDVAIQIAKALQCAHRNNIIHRDIKPHNILVTENGLVKVTDFGIAKATNSVTITNTSKVMGSAHYFSPEQAKGSFVDCRTDIYSLGIVMYEMVTGKVPYDAESPVSVALKHIQEQVIPPKNLNPSLSNSFNNIILKSIEKEPIRRYQNTDELLLDLNKIKNNENVNINFSHLDDDRTRVMDAVKVNDRLNNKSFDEEDYEEDDEEDVKNPMDKRKKNIIVFITAVILFLAVGSASGYVIYNKFLNPSASAKSVVVPDIIGATKEEATKRLEEKKLIFQMGGTEENDKPEGTVISCFPNVGTSVKQNSEIRVILSSGKEKPAVPDLKEIDLEVAKQILSKYNLKIGNDIKYEYNDNVPKNSIISQNPNKGDKVEEGSTIYVVVSKGPEIKYSTVPSLNGKTLEEARTLLANSNLKLGAQKTANTKDKTLDGKIFEQNIEALTQVKEGTTVNITYYVYKEEENPNPDENIDKNGDNGNNTENNNENNSENNNSGNNDQNNNDSNKNKGNR